MGGGEQGADLRPGGTRHHTRCRARYGFDHMPRDLERERTTGVIGRSSRRESGVAGTGSVLPPPVIAPPDPPSAGSATASTRTQAQKPRRAHLEGHSHLRCIGPGARGALYGYLQYRLGQIKSIVSHSLRSGGERPAVRRARRRIRHQGREYGCSGERLRDLVRGRRAAQRHDQDPPYRSGLGYARLLSIPRDTYVAMSGLPASSGLATDNKINTSFNDGPGPLIQTIENTFGIPIAHFVIVDFNGVIDLVNSVGGINLDFPYPVRDNDDGNNNSGLDITHSGCQTLNGTMALALARSCYYQYEERPGYWVYDPSSDLGRIQRQNTIIEAVIDKAKSSYNPFTVNAFIGSIVHDITKDDGMSSDMIISLAQRYHAFSGSSLQTFTMPTAGSYSSVAGDVEVVEEPTAQQVITQFLGTEPNSAVTPPLDAYGSPIAVPSTVPSSASGSSSGSGASGSSAGTPVAGRGPFNPTSC